MPLPTSFLSIDYSGIEMRVAASEANDARMCDIFNRNGDIHSETAAAMFGIPLADVHPKKHRYPAKRTGFGILYDISAMGLHELFISEGVTDFDEDDCQQFIDTWFATYPGVAAKMEAYKREAIQTGRVRDMWGRYRIIPEVYSALPRIRSAGLRMAANAPIQSGAQGIIKEAMAQLQPVTAYYAMLHADCICKLLMQIHDELIWEVSDVLIPEVAPVFKAVMENVVTLRVPVKCDVEVAKTWADLKAYEFTIPTTNEGE